MILRRDVPLAPLTTYKVGGPAAWFAEPATVDELVAAVGSVPPSTPILVLGRGSNVVVADAGFPGLVLRLGGDFARIELRDDGTIAAGAAVPLPRLARFAADAGRAGLGFYVGIPGSVGGAVRMNAGGHGSDTAAVLVDAAVYDLAAGEVVRLTGVELGLGYRRSALDDRHVVLGARFATEPGEPTRLDAELREITRWRRAHQPGGTLNAGSVFKNPAGDHAGRIIDELGLKGYRVGRVTVSPLHGNFFVAEPGATAAEIRRLVEEVRRIVAERAGIELEPELRFVGDFEEEDAG